MDAGKEGCGFELKMKQPKLILLPFARKHRINIVLAGLLTCFLKFTATGIVPDFNRIPF